MKRSISVDAYFQDAERWRDELSALRNVLINAQEGKTKALRRNKGSTAAFREMKKGQQREYAEYVSSAKRDDTKQKRIAKILPMIAAGVGLNDKYRR